MGVEPPLNKRQRGLGDLSGKEGTDLQEGMITVFGGERRRWLKEGQLQCFFGFG